MKISVAIATFNGENYIEEQLRSILIQTIQVDEVIITDDKSTDNTVNIIEKFITDNNLSDKWSVSVNDAGKGFAENFRGAIEKTNGNYVFLCDQDDVWAEDKVEVMIDAMERLPEIGVLTSDYSVFFNDAGEARTEKRSCRTDKILLNARTRFLRSLGSVMCVRRSFYEQTKKYWYDGWAHDEYFWCVSALLEKLYHIDYISTKRRIHSGQVSGSTVGTKEKRIKYLEGEIKTAEKLISIANEINAPAKTIKLYEKNLIATKKRLLLIKDRKISEAFGLLFLLKYYYSEKSYFKEIKIALTGK